MILGVIADDFTGATDVASMLVRAGMHTVQVMGVPAAGLPQADAVFLACGKVPCMVWAVKPCVINVMSTIIIFICRYLLFFIGHM